MAIQSLTRDELLALLEAARTKRVRDYLMIWLAFRYGLRASEVVALKRDNFSATHITVQRLKGSLKTTQLLTRHPEPLPPALSPLNNFPFSMGRATETAGHSGIQTSPAGRVEHFRNRELRLYRLIYPPLFGEWEQGRILAAFTHESNRTTGT